MAGFITLLGLSGLPMAAQASDAHEPARLAQCSWDQPGQNPFMGDVVAAVDRYTDIPLATRARLKQRMAKRNYDDIASIRRDSIEGKARYEPTIRDMHFGVGRVCSVVSRKAWLATQQERGLVYCEGTECIIVPTVCRNVSRIKRDASAVLGSRDLLAPDPVSPADALLFDAPSAGPVEPQWDNRSGNLGITSNGVSPGDPGATMSSGDPGAAPGGLAKDSGGRESATGSGPTFDSSFLPAISPVPPTSSGSAVPEPQTWQLLLLGAATAAVPWRRRRRRLTVA